MKNNWKTTSVAVVGAIVLLICLLLLGTKKITAGDFAVIVSSVGAFLTVLVGLFARDANNKKEDGK